MNKFYNKMIVQVHFNRDYVRKNPLPAAGFETTTIWLASSYQDLNGNFYFYPISVDEILNLNRQSNLTEQDLFDHKSYVDCVTIQFAQSFFRMNQYLWN